MHGEKVVLMSRSIKILIDSGRENSASFYRREGSCFWLFSPWSLMGHPLRPIFMLWLLKIWQVSSRGKCMHYLQTFLLIADADSFAWSYSCAKWKAAAIKILLLFMAGLFIGFLVEKCTPFPSHRKSFFWWHGFQKWASTSPCWMRNRVEKSEAILALLDGFQELHLDRYAWVIIAFDVFFLIISWSPA